MEGSAFLPVLLLLFRERESIVPRAESVKPFTPLSLITQEETREVGFDGGALQHVTVLSASRWQECGLSTEDLGSRPIVGWPKISKAIKYLAHLSRRASSDHLVEYGS